MTDKRKRILKLVDVMKAKIIQLKNGYITDKNLTGLTEKMK